MKEVWPVSLIEGDVASISLSKDVASVSLSEGGVVSVPQSQ